MKHLLISASFAAAALLAVSAPASAAGNAAAGKGKAAACGACHGANGVSQVPMYPNLAGQKEQYLAKQLHDFKAGKRVDPIMGPMAKPLSDQDIADLAAYFASLKP